MSGCAEVRDWIGAGMEDGLAADASDSGVQSMAAERSGHFAACSDCRRELLDADPTLLFLGADRLEVSETEVESVRRTVQAMRRTRQLERPMRTERRAGRRSSGRVQRAVAAGFALAMVLALPAGERPPRTPAAVPTAVGEEPTAVTAFFDRRGATLVSDLESPSVLEDLDRPQARVYQLTEHDLAVVMIVDETLDL